MKIQHLFEDIAPDMEKKFGRVLFGDWQKQHGFRTEKERDTEYEKQIFHYMDSWFKGAHYLEEVQDAMIELSKLKDDYPTLLKPTQRENTKYLYRGVRMNKLEGEMARNIWDSDISHDKKYKDHELPVLDVKRRDKSDLRDIKHMWSDDWIEKQFNKYILYKSKEPILYQSRQTAESWTLSMKSAIDVLVNHFAVRPYDVIVFEAEVPTEERLFSIKFTNKMYSRQKQYEIIRVSDKPIKAQVYRIEKRY